MSHLRAIAITALFLSTAVSAEKRPLSFKDFDRWNSIQSQEISRDGKFVAYALMPQTGDGSIVLKNLDTGQEKRFPAGAMPQRTGNEENAGEPGPPAPRGPKLEFTADGRYLIAGIFPSKSAIDAAKRAKKKPEEMPKTGMLVINTGAGTATTVEDVATFSLPETSSDVIVYHRTAKPAPPKTPRRPQPATLLIRKLATTDERSIDNVTEYTLAEDGALIVYITPDGVFQTRRGELKDNLSGYVRRVEKGEKISVTLHGRVVAELAPPRHPMKKRSENPYDRLVKLGILIPPIEDGDPLADWPKLRLPRGLPPV